ncbi:helix-turn-helix domain-containing protein [Subtercola sp. YIM 133946]|uniref:helix-turn-helix domain-containing protein n=1 Tax=Subtercola sp. YIM 133946 TaxID=3118909 RepID=UPI002F933102
MAENGLIANARRAQGLTQQALSRRTGIAETAVSSIENGRDARLSTVERLLAGADHSLIAIPSTRAGAADVAGDIRSAVKARRPDVAARSFIQLNDNLAAEHNESRYGLGLTEPAPTGNKRWDAALAGLVAFRLREEGFPPPTWTTRDSRHLKKAWTFTSGTYLTPVRRSAVPPDFLERGVLIDAASLRSV